MSCTVTLSIWPTTPIIDEVLTDHPELGGGFDGVVDGGTA